MVKLAIASQQTLKRMRNRRVLYLGLDPAYAGVEGEIIHCPLIEIVPRPPDDPAIAKALQLFPCYTDLLFTSKSAVNILAAYLPLHNFTIKDAGAKKIAAVGRQTAASLKPYGLKATLIAEEETAEGLATALSTQSFENRYFFWPHSSLARPVLADFLRSRGARFEACAFYDTQPRKLMNPPPLDTIDEIIFTSPSTVDAYLTLIGPLPRNKILTPIGPVTAAKLNAERMTT